MRLLVTGGAGYIGAVTTARLIADGHDVVVLDDFSSVNSMTVPDGADWVPGAVGDEAAVEQALGPGVDACLHFAASIEAGESMRRPEAFFANNTAESLRLLRVLVSAGVRRFVLSSTAAVYGTPSRTPVTEQEPTKPTNAYGASKLFVEQALEWLAELRGLRYAALRYFNAAGAVGALGERHDPETHLIPLVLQVAEGKRDHIDVFGTDYPTRDGTGVRDYVHVADIADAHVAALQALDEHRRLVCNVGNGRGHSVLEVVEAARQVTGHPIPVRLRGRRPGDPPSLVASADRAMRLLGWEPRRPDLRDIVGSAWDFQRAGGSPGPSQRPRLRAVAE